MDNILSVKEFWCYCFCSIFPCRGHFPRPASTLPDPVRPLTENSRFFRRYSEKRLQAPHVKEPSFRFTTVLHFSLARSQKGLYRF